MAFRYAQLITSFACGGALTNWFALREKRNIQRSHEYEVRYTAEKHHYGVHHLCAFVAEKGLATEYNNRVKADFDNPQSECSKHHHYLLQPSNEDGGKWNLVLHQTPGGGPPFFYFAPSGTL